MTTLHSAHDDPALDTCLVITPHMTTLHSAQDRPSR